MSRIFSSAELLEGILPDRGHFNEALSTFHDQTKTAIASGSLVSGLVYGSVARGTPGLRSDFDHIVVCTSEADFAVAAEINQAVFTAADGRVPINGVAYAYDVLSGGRSEIDRFFGSHLTEGTRLVIGEDPAQYIRYADVPAEITLTDYLHNKKRRLSAAHVSADRRDQSKGIERMLELPLAIGRKLLPALAEIEGTAIPQFDSADKPYVEHHSICLFDELGVGPGARRLTELDQTYTATLHGVIDGNIPVIDHETCVQSLYRQLPEAIKWLDAVERAVTRRIKPAADGIV